MTNEEKLEYIREEQEFMDCLDIPYKKDVWECAIENPNGDEAHYIIGLYEKEYGDKYE